MIGRLSGKIDSLQDGRLVLIDVGGVGYEVICTRAAFENLNIGEHTQLITYTDMRESALTLFGFVSSLEKQLFLFLNEVNGVGPRSALEILSTFNDGELLKIIGSGDVAKIQRAKGVGKKTAERIVLELKDKVSRYAVLNTSHVTAKLREQIEQQVTSDETEDSVLALISLGFSRAESERAVNRVKEQNAQILDPGEIVKGALGYL